MSGEWYDVSELCNYVKVVSNVAGPVLHYMLQSQVRHMQIKMIPAIIFISSLYIVLSSNIKRMKKLHHLNITSNLQIYLMNCYGFVRMHPPRKVVDRFIYINVNAIYILHSRVYSGLKVDIYSWFFQALPSTVQHQEMPE